MEQKERLEPKDLLEMPRSTLISIYRTFNYWGWPEILGPAPIEDWYGAPEYRRTWMTEDTVTRKDFIKPYMEALIVAGITGETVYGR